MHTPNFERVNSNATCVALPRVAANVAGGVVGLVAGDAVAAQRYCSITNECGGGHNNVACEAW